MQPMPIHIRAAVIDLYNGEPNQGMRCIQELLLAQNRQLRDATLSYQIFETRLTGETPSLDFDFYISTGGPGSPFDGEGQTWETNYFRWLEAVWAHNQNPFNAPKKVLFICHSFQMMVRFFELAAVTERHSESFGIFPVHPTRAGLVDPLFADLPNPFYAADFRHWQVTEANEDRFAELNARIIALEKYRPHIYRPRAIMAIRVSPHMVGVQFHPEADPAGMSLHFRQEKRRSYIVQRYGQDKYERILHRLEDPHYIQHTHHRVIPNFLRDAIQVQKEAPMLA